MQCAQGNVRPTRPKGRVFTPLPKPLSHIYMDLYAQGRLRPISQPIAQGPLSRRHDPRQVCAFHSHAQGHSTDNCHALRHEIQDLIDQGEFHPWGHVAFAGYPNDMMINVISAEEDELDPADLIVPESEVIEKFSQLHRRMNEKGLVMDKVESPAEGVTKDEFIELSRQVRNSQAIMKLLFERVQGLEGEVAKLKGKDNGKENKLGTESQKNGVTGHASPPMVSMETISPQKSQIILKGVKKEDRQFTPLPLPIDMLYRHLRGMMMVFPVRPTPYSLDKKVTKLLDGSYTPGSYCSFHSLIEGHSLENCWTLKHRIQDLIDNGELIITKVPDGHLLQLRGASDTRHLIVRTLSDQTSVEVAYTNFDGEGREQSREGVPSIRKSQLTSQAWYAQPFDPVPPGYRLNNYVETPVIIRRKAPVLDKAVAG